MTKEVWESIFCGTPTRGTSKSRAREGSSEELRNRERGAGRGECRKRESGSQEALSGIREDAAPVNEKISPGGALREEREGMGRGRDACCDAIRGERESAGAGVTAQTGEGSSVWSSNFKDIKERYHGEFDSGSERTLAAWIRHASRTEWTKLAWEA